MKLIGFCFWVAIGILIFFLLCRNGIAVVCSVVVADGIFSDEVNQVLFLMGYWNW